MSTPPKKTKKPSSPRKRKPAENEAARYIRLAEMVVGFLTEKYEVDVEEAFYCDWSGVFPGEPENAEGTPLLATFHDWLIHTSGVIEPGRSGIDLYLEKRGEELIETDRALLGRMNDSVISLLDLRPSPSGNGLVCGDLLLGDEFEIDGDALMLDDGRMLVGGRRMALDGKPALCMGIYPFEYSMRGELLAEVRMEFEEYRVEMPSADMEQYLRDVDPLPDMWLDDFEKDFTETLPPVTFTALFDILDEHGLRERLRMIPLLVEREPDLFEWVADPGEQEPGQRGAVILMGDTLALGAFSQELREEGKAMLLSAGSEFLRHNSDVEVDTDGQFELPGGK